MPEQELILLVEDEFLIAELVDDALRQCGYEVHRESKGERAIAALDDGEHFSGLVTDIRLAGQTSGWEVAHHARRLNPDIAVVYMSGHSGRAYETEGVPQSTFVQKPFAPDQVTAAVSRWLKDSS